MAEQVSENPTLPTLLFSIEGGQMLLPDIAIAEIIDYYAVNNEDADDKPDWWLGQLHWRGLEVPLISLESINHGAFFTQKTSLKIIVVNALHELKESIGYWAFVALDTPKLQRIQSDSLALAEDESFGEVSLMHVELFGQSVSIPDMEKIETLILPYHHS
jgi:chemosensory pili system protein ChpC